MKLNLSGVSETLLLPLYARAYYHDILKDDKAVELVNNIDYDFESFRQKTGDSMLFCLTRTLHFDNEIQRFLLLNPNATIVDLGCGLDTGFYRNDNYKLRWFDIDLLCVIKLRNKLLHESCKRYFCAWLNIIESNFESLVYIKNENDKFLFLAGGLLQYFEESQVKELLIKLADNSPGAEFIFDCPSILLVNVFNEHMESQGLKDINIKWGLDDAKDLEKWSTKIKVVSQIPYFDSFIKNENIPYNLKQDATKYSLVNTSKMIHLKFEN